MGHWWILIIGRLVWAGGWILRSAGSAEAAQAQAKCCKPDGTLLQTGQRSNTLCCSSTLSLRHQQWLQTSDGRMEETSAGIVHQPRASPDRKLVCVCVYLYVCARLYTATKACCHQTRILCFFIPILLISLAALSCCRLWCKPVSWTDSMSTHKTHKRHCVLFWLRYEKKKTPFSIIQLFTSSFDGRQ